MKSIIFINNYEPRHNLQYLKSHKMQYFRYKNNSIYYMNDVA